MNNNYSFYEKVIFVGIVIVAIYYIVSPYNDCRGKYSAVACGKNGLFWQEDILSNDIENYGIFKKEHIDKLKGDIEDILDGRIYDEDEKLDVLKQISNLKIKLDGISEEDKIFDKSKFQKKLRFDELMQKEEELWERVKKFGRDQILLI